MTDVTPKPVLWHLGVSHYSEKVRWAVAYKGIEHERKTIPPGAHMLTALWLTREELRASPENEQLRLPRRDSIARRLVDDWIRSG